MRSACAQRRADVRRCCSGGRRARSAPRRAARPAAAGAISLSAALAGVSSAASGIQTAATVTHQVQLPAVDPAVPARLGPVRLGVDGGVRHHPRLAVLLVPDAAPGAQHGAVDRGRPPAGRPGPEQGDQVPPEAGDLRRQRVRQRRQPPLPGAARRGSARPAGSAARAAPPSRRSAGPARPAARAGGAGAARS